MATPPVLLVIFDGFGVNPSRAYNAWARARTPHLDHYFASNPHCTLQASGAAVGLTDGQFGNSEVGHLTMGSGRVLKQNLLRIRDSLADGSITQIPAWRDMLQGTPRLHLVGLVSDGGVHSHLDHLLALLPRVVEAGIEPVIHMVTDGRDTSPRCADRFAAILEAKLRELGRGRIASVSGRYYAMDRAGFWDRTQQAWLAMICGRGEHAGSAEEAIRRAWERGEGDEFILPTVVGEPEDSRVAPDDALFFFNFRSDRMRQLVAAMGLHDFDSFDREAEGPRRVVCMTEYDAEFPFAILFSPEMPRKVLAEVISDAGLSQFHCAETEKYAHVTHFFNGGREEAFPGEDRAIVPSPQVATYDLKPEMSAPQVADRVIAAIRSEVYSFVVVNFANGDMVGHTAVVPAVIEAVEALDLQFHRVVQAALSRGFRVLLTADHGNCDEMVDVATGEPHTQHTVYPVPFLLIGMDAARLGTGRGLADVAPTVLDLLGLEQPAEMNGRSIVLRGDSEVAGE